MTSVKIVSFINLTSSASPHHGTSSSDPPFFLFIVPSLFQLFKLYFSVSYWLFPITHPALSICPPLRLSCPPLLFLSMSFLSSKFLLNLRPSPNIHSFPQFSLISAETPGCVSPFIFHPLKLFSHIIAVF